MNAYDVLFLSNGFDRTYGSVHKRLLVWEEYGYRRHVYALERDSAMSMEAGGQVLTPSAYTGQSIFPESDRDSANIGPPQAKVISTDNTDSLRERLFNLIKL